MVHSKAKDRKWTVHVCMNCGTVAAAEDVATGLVFVPQALRLSTEELDRRRSSGDCSPIFHIRIDRATDVVWNTADAGALGPHSGHQAMPLLRGLAEQLEKGLREEEERMNERIAYVTCPPGRSAAADMCGLRCTGHSGSRKCRNSSSFRTRL